MSQSELNTTARDLLAVKAMISELEAEAEVLTDKMKGFMVEAAREELSGPGWKSSWKNVTSSRFDSKSFKAQYSDLYQAFSKPTTTCRFMIQPTA